MGQSSRSTGPVDLDSCCFHPSRLEVVRALSVTVLAEEHDLIARLDRVVPLLEVQMTLHCLGQVELFLRFKLEDVLLVAIAPGEVDRVGHVHAGLRPAQGNVVKEVVG